MRDYAVLCVGQGSQSPEMFDLALAHPRGREVVEAFADAIGFDLVARARAGDDLFDNAFAQAALVAASLATWVVLEASLPAPRLFAGYSVGELAAWGCAGAWTASASATVVTRRARAMDADTPPGCGMLAVRGLRHGEVEALADGLHVAIVNGVDHVVLAGAGASLHAVSDRLVAHGASVRPLDVRVPSHTPILRGASEAFRDALAETPPRDVAVPVLRGIDGRACRRGADATDALARAISGTIRWDRCEAQMAESGALVLLELGPGNALTRIAAEAEQPFVARSVSDFRSLDRVAAWLLRQLDA